MSQVASPPPQTPSSSASTQSCKSRLSQKRSASVALSDSEDTASALGARRPRASFSKEKGKAERMTKKLKGLALQRRLRRGRRTAPIMKVTSHSSVKKTVRTASGNSLNSASQKDKGKGKEVIVNTEGGVVNEVEAIVEPVGEDELERLRKKVEEQRLLLDAHKHFLDSLTPSLTCQICFEPMLRPYSLAPCGHSACYRCLNEWFRAPPPHIGQPVPEHLRHNFDTENQALLSRDSPMLLRKEKACPVCRAVIREAPIESWGLKDIISHLFAHKGNVAKDLYPTYVAPDVPEAAISSAEAWQGIFRKTVTNAADRRNHEEEQVDGVNTGNTDHRAFFDEEDNVYRCTSCYHEIWEGLCSSCGRAYPGLRDPEDDDDEIDGGAWMDAAGFDDDMYHGELHVDDDDFGAEEHENGVDFDGIMGVLNHARRFIGHNGARPRGRPHAAGPVGDVHSEDDEDHDGEGYESSFIDDDDAHPIDQYLSAEDEVDHDDNARRSAHRNYGSDHDMVELMDEDENDEEEHIPGGFSTWETHRNANSGFRSAHVAQHLRNRNRHRRLTRIASDISDDGEDEDDDRADEFVEGNSRHLTPRASVHRLLRVGPDGLESDSDDGGRSRVNRIVNEDDEEPTNFRQRQRSGSSVIARALGAFGTWGTRNAVIESDEESTEVEDGSEHSEDGSGVWQRYRGGRQVISDEEDEEPAWD